MSEDNSRGVPVWFTSGQGMVEKVVVSFMGGEQVYARLEKPTFVQKGDTLNLSIVFGEQLAADLWTLAEDTGIPEAIRLSARESSATLPEPEQPAPEAVPPAAGLILRLRHVWINILVALGRSDPNGVGR